MGYFQADERYLGQGGAEAAVETPWNVQISEAGAVGQVRLTWRAAYTPVDSYGIMGQPADGDVATWQEWARIPAPAGEALLTLAPGVWRLCLTARRGSTDSAPTPALCWRVEPPAPPLPIAPPVTAVVPTPLRPAMPSAPAPVPTPPIPTVINPPAPEPEFDWTAIDQALHANQAQLGRHGLFVRRRP